MLGHVLAVRPKVKKGKSIRQVRSKRARQPAKRVINWDSPPSFYTSTLPQFTASEKTPERDVKKQQRGDYSDVSKSVPSTPKAKSGALSIVSSAAKKRSASAPTSSRVPVKKRKISFQGKQIFSLCPF